MKTDRKAIRLYAVTDRTWLKDGQTLPQAVEQAVKGGATFIQLREKHLAYDEFKALALEVKAVCAKYKIPFVINDNVELARDVDADGVHIGQTDMAVQNARQLLGEGKIIGVTAATVEKALAAEANGADYIGTGAVFATSTKGDAKPVDKTTVKQIAQAVNIPVLAIGGVNKDNIRQLAGLSLAGVAVVSAIFAQSDVCEAAKELRTIADEVFE